MGPIVAVGLPRWWAHNIHSAGTKGPYGVEVCLGADVAALEAELARVRRQNDQFHDVCSLLERTKDELDATRQNARDDRFTFEENTKKLEADLARRMRLNDQLNDAVARLTADLARVTAERDRARRGTVNSDRHWREADRNLKKENARLRETATTLLDALSRATIVGVVGPPRMDGVRWTSPNGKRVVEARDALSHALAQEKTDE